jgi:holo-[acyl-carrier protein] synthase
MKSLGIDAVEINRFNNWQNYPPAQLKKIFTEQEITYCLKISAKSSERFAARFAAKEACYKALCAFLYKPISFIQCAKNIEIINTQNNCPIISLNKIILEQLDQDNFIMKLSLTHTNSSAFAVVIIL